MTPTKIKADFTAVFDDGEVDVYVNRYFLTSVNIEDIAPEARVEMGLTSSKGESIEDRLRKLIRATYDKYNTTVVPWKQSAIYSIMETIK